MLSRRVDRVRVIAGVAIWAAMAAAVQSHAESRDLARTTLHLDRYVLGSLGVEVAAAPGARRVEDSWTHSYRVAAPSRLELWRGDAREGDFRAGFLAHEGGPVLSLPDGELSLEGFELRVVEPPFVFDLVDRDGRRWFLLDYLHLMRSSREPAYLLRNMDLSIAPELAERLGRPELTGAYAGYLEVELPSAFVDAGNVDAGNVGAGNVDTGDGAAELAAGGPTCRICEANFDPALEVDVALTLLGEPSQVSPPEPGGRVAMGFEARLENRGTADIAWFRSIAPDGEPGSSVVGPHPYLVLHFYRLADGVLTQLGLSDVKHAFFATNYGCRCCGAQALFVGCGDIYGAGTNVRQLFFAPRHEVEAFSGAWERVGSHFDGDPVDDRRDHGEDSDDHPDPFAHRLVVMETELSTPSAEYFIEGWYLAQGDVNLFNGMGHMKVRPVSNQGTWSFPLAAGQLVPGSMLDRVVDPAAEGAGRSNQTLDTGRGHLQLVSTAQPALEGRVRYEYALMNFDFDGQVRRFSVPVAPEVALTSLGFTGAGPGPSPSWVATRETDALVWTAPEGGALDWGSLVSFRFEADAGPATSVAALSALETRPGEVLAIAMRGPTRVPEPAAGLFGSAALLSLASLVRARRGGRSFGGARGGVARWAWAAAHSR
ncbi:MAG: hypothetical protein JRH19_24895 [Deltaproteobacteria bacterium]|nr:hypothetical protein [Deltaproteobacteria bacterium]